MGMKKVLWKILLLPIMLLFTILKKKFESLKSKFPFFFILISIFSELKYITSFTNNTEFTFLEYSTVVSITLENQLQIH